MCQESVRGAKIGRIGGLRFRQHKLVGMRCFELELIGGVWGNIGSAARGAPFSHPRYAGIVGWSGEDCQAQHHFNVSRTKALEVDIGAFLVCPPLFTR